MRDRIKQWAYRALSPHLLRRHVNHQATIGLSYHRFLPATGHDPRPHMAIDPAVFAQHLRWLNELGACIGPDEYLQGEQAPGLSFLLSFDDGYADNAETLPALLEVEETPCCIYAVSDYIAGKIRQLPHDAQAGFQPRACTTEQLHTLARHPLITIGSHTVSHRILSGLTPDEIRSELRDSREALEQMIQQPVQHFAAPSGQPKDLPEALPALAREAGYRSIATNFGGYNAGPAASAVQHIRRVPMTVLANEWSVKGWALGGHNLREMKRNATFAAWDQPDTASNEEGPDDAS